jgi:hypothetical protein
VSAELPGRHSHVELPVNEMPQEVATNLYDTSPAMNARGDERLIS